VTRILVTGASVSSAGPWSLNLQSPSTSARAVSTPQRSAFLSAFFTVVGCHGLHVTVGLIWLAVMMAQVAVKGFRPAVDRRLLCFALFWHALDIIWVWLFTAIYLMGIRP
jgi:cytochrome o ubiquinol oxidase subunit III